MKGICFKVRLLILSLFFITLFSACNEEPEIPQPTEAIDYSSNIRSLSEAMDIAQAFIGQNGERTRTSKSLKSIQDATVITSKSSLSRSQCDTLIYAFDFEDEEGFILIAAPRNIESVLAMTEKGSFNSFQTYSNKSFQYALNAAKDYANNALSEPSKVEPIDKRVFKTVDSIVENIKSGPRVNVAWDQLWPAGLYFANHISGCVPLAISQILTFFEQPKSLNYTFPERDKIYETIDWSDIKKHVRSNLRYNSSSFMFNTHYNSCGCTQNGHKTIGRLTRQIAYIGGINPSATDSTGTGGTYDQAYTAIVGIVGNILNVTKGTGVNDLYAALMPNAVCYIRGASENNTGGHAWVADGRWRFKRHYWDYVGTPIPTKVGEPQQYDYELVNEYETVFTYFHYNWGWGGNSNGWFSINIFNPSKGEEYDNSFLSNSINRNYPKDIKYIQLKTK